MNTVKDYINSGILELYVLGMTTDEENIEISKLAAKNSDIQKEIEAIEKTLLLTSKEIAPKLSPEIKAMTLATIDYMERLKNGEEYVNAPTIGQNSKTVDFQTWIDRPNMQVSEDFDTIEVKIISANPEVTTAIVWLKHGSPIEIHDNEFEHFLIVEGTCTITIGEVEHNLIAGDYLSIPLYIGHSVEVTSENVCKIILQRVAA